jgi:hypothetical protein
MLMKRIRGLLLVFGAMIITCQSCSYKLSLSGASTVGMKTIRVDFFENNAPLVVNTLSNQFTEALKDRIRSTTSLSIVRAEEADAVISGSITDYSIAPVSINATANNVAPIAGQSRVTITVNVKYVNNVNKTLSFEESFTKYQNYSGDINSQEQTLITAINKQLTEDIFNRAFAQW